MNRTERLLRWLNEPIGTDALDDIRRRERRKHAKRIFAENVALAAALGCLMVLCADLILQLIMGA